MKNPIVKLNDWFQPAKDALGRVRDAEQQKRREHAEAVAERGRLLSLRAPRADLLARLDTEIATLGAAWAQGRGAALVGCLSGSMVPTPTGAVEGPIYATLVNVLGDLSVPAACSLMPEMMRAGLVRLLDGAPEYDAGEPMGTRVARLAEVDARIAELEVQHQNLCDAAHELGVTLVPLEENRARKAHAQWRAERAQARR